MTGCIRLAGINGSNPLGFMAALGILRVIPGARLGFFDDGSFQAFVVGVSQDDLAKRVTADAKDAANAPAWHLTYDKPATKRKSSERVADLKPPVDRFRSFLKTCIEAWLNGKDEAAAYAAAYATDVALDSKGNTKPTAFHFTAGNQKFLEVVEEIRASITQEWVERSLFNGNAERPGSNLRWDPGAERNRALRADDPSRQQTRVNAPLEWLAFRALPLFPSFPRGSKIITTGVFDREDETVFKWPLWSVPVSLATARSVLQVDWTGNIQEQAARHIFAICSAIIRRTGQGYGSFGPTWVDR
jgi:hypothetical protein